MFYITLACISYPLLIFSLNKKWNNKINSEYMKNVELLNKVDNEINIVNVMCGKKTVRLVYGDRIDYLIDYFEEYNKLDIIYTIIQIALVPIMIFHYIYLFN